MARITREAVTLEKQRDAPDPFAAEYATIESTWGPTGWYLTSIEELLRDDPDPRYHDEKRQQARAIADARRAELRAPLLARSQRR